MLSVSEITSGIPLYIAVVAIVPPPFPSVMSIFSPFFTLFLKKSLDFNIPIEPTAPLILSPKTKSPPILNVLPASIGISKALLIVVTPASKSINIPISLSSERCMSTIRPNGYAPLTIISRNVALVA
uniref:Orf c04047 protein n=1 Tax=Saccharolobus solfataricus TaxID=2287 RepID=P95985_SACSO|nr:orf c04047 [Saccharolobus solfataricus P2]